MVTQGGVPLRGDANNIRQIHAALTDDARTFTTTYHVAHATYLKIVAAEQKAGLPASSPGQKTFWPGPR